MMERAVAVGMFDGVHLGHQALVGQLAQCAKTSGLSSCVITFADHPLRQIRPEKAPRLLTTCRQKTELLRQAGADEVIALDFNDELRRLTAREFMRETKERLGVKLWLMGFNHRFGSDGISDFNEYRRIGRELGIEVELASCEVVEGIDLPVSSSLIRKSLDEGGVDQANRMLGRPYSIIGTVEEGLRIGRTIGFPTANISPEMQNQEIPKNGAYACEAVIDGQEWPAMTNIGHRPTIGEGLDATIETHVIGFEGDLYGKHVEVRFIKRLRDECRFGDLECLKKQLAFDLESVLQETKIRKISQKGEFFG